MIQFGPQEQFWESAAGLAAWRRLRLIRHNQGHPHELDHEFENLRGTLAWLCSSADAQVGPIFLEYLEALAPLFHQRGLAAEFLHLCDVGLNLCDRCKRNPGWLFLLRSEAQVALGQWEAATSSVKDAIATSGQQDARTHARSMFALGRLLLNRGFYAQALEVLREAERLLTALHDAEGVAGVRSEFAAYHLNRRELERALACYLEADQIRKHAGAQTTSDHVLLMLGVVYRKKGEYQKAIVYLRQLWQRANAQGNHSALATAAHHLAWTYLELRDALNSRRFCGQAMALYEEIGDLRGMSDVWDQLGLIALMEGRGEEALLYLERSLASRRAIGNQHGAASSLQHLAVANLRRGRLVAAVRNFLHSLSLYWRMDMLTRRRLATMVNELITKY